MPNPSWSKFVIFMQFMGTILQNNRLVHSPRDLESPGNHRSALVLDTFSHQTRLTTFLVLKINKNFK